MGEERALGTIVVSLNCTAYHWGSFIMLFCACGGDADEI